MSISISCQRYCYIVHSTQKDLRQNKKIRSRWTCQAAPAERSWRGVLRGHVPSKSPSADGETPLRHALGARRRWVRKATAFRGRSEQDRSTLCAVCSTDILKTFQWNVFNRNRISRDTACRVRQNPKQPQKGCANVDAALLEFMVEMENRIMPQPELPSSKMQSSPPALLPPPASSNEHGSRPAAILRIPQR